MAGPEAVEAPRGPPIWLLTIAAPGDQQPFSRLAAALRRAGHRVKCFGQSYVARTFTDYGLDFEPINHPIALHRENTKVRAGLRDAARKAGFAEGPGQEEDFFLHSILLKTEFILRSVSEHAKRRGNAAGFNKVEKDRVRFNDLIMRGGLSDLEATLDFIVEKEKECLNWQAGEEKMSAEACQPHRVERSKGFREFLRQEAERMGCSAFDLAEVMYDKAFSSLKAVVTEPLTPKELRLKAIHSEALRLTRYLEGVEPKAFWEEWTASFPLACGRDLMARGMAHYMVTSVYNVTKTIEAIPAEDRPSMAIFHLHCVSAALTLARKYDVMPIRASTGKPIIDRTKHMMGYARFALGENEDGPLMPYTPVRNMTPIVWSDWLYSVRLLCCCSPVAMSKKDWTQLAQEADSNAAAEMCRSGFTGYWCHEPEGNDVPDVSRFASETEKDRLLKFLEGVDKPPICVSWGVILSYPQGPQELARMVVKALKPHTRSCIFLAGWSHVTEEHLKDAIDDEEEEDPKATQAFQERFLWLSHAPHGWLLPKCCILVHSGGSGTCHAALRAGVPQIVCPDGASDQPDNGKWVQNLGVGLDTITIQDLAFGELGNKIRTLLDDDVFTVKAQEVAKVVKKEKGVERAVELVEEYLREGFKHDFVSPLMGTKPPYPWLEGPFTIQKGDGDKIMDTSIVGSQIQANGGTFVWLRYGNYDLPDPHGVAGRKKFNMEMFAPGFGHSYAVTHYGGRVIVERETGSIHKYLGTVDDEGMEKATAAIASYIQWVTRLD